MDSVVQSKRVRRNGNDEEFLELDSTLGNPLQEELESENNYHQEYSDPNSTFRVRPAYNSSVTSTCGMYSSRVARNEQQHMARNEQQHMVINEQRHMARNEQQHMTRKEQRHMARNEQRHMARNEQRHMARNEQRHMARNEQRQIGGPNKTSNTTNGRLRYNAFEDLEECTSLKQLPHPRELFGKRSCKPARKQRTEQVNAVEHHISQLRMKRVQMIAEIEQYKAERGYHNTSDPVGNTREHIGQKTPEYLPIPDYPSYRRKPCMQETSRQFHPYLPMCPKRNTEE